THLRNVSAVQPILEAIDSSTAHCDSYSLWCSYSNRTARSRTSGEYLTCFFITLSSQEIESPVNPGRFKKTSLSNRLTIRLESIVMKAPDFRKRLEKISQLSCGQKEQVRHCWSEVTPQAAVVKWLENSLNRVARPARRITPIVGGNKRSCSVLAVARVSTRSQPYREPL
ncbi:hypothetical protein SAMN05421754_11121, partial [Nitrosomonas sp. Nm58]